jgi:hypothetical protein
MFELVNFNGDASCLKRADFIHALKSNEILKWLHLYDISANPVSIGFTGTSLSDLALFSRSPVIESVARPFVHAISAYMPPILSSINILLGHFVERLLLERPLTCFLPAEFSLRMHDILTLCDLGFTSTFHRYSPFLVPTSIDSSCQFSNTPFYPLLSLQHPCGSSLLSLSIDPLGTAQYHNTVQLLNPESPTSSIWRDGESFLFLPNGLDREKYYLNVRKPCLHTHSFINLCSHINLPSLDYYPLRPLDPWIGDYSNKWFTNICTSLQASLLSTDRCDIYSLLIILLAQSSDLLASVSKPNVTVKLCSISESESFFDYTIFRDHRTSEAEAMDWLSSELLNTSFNQLFHHRQAFNPTARSILERINSYANILIDLSPIISSLNTLEDFKSFLTNYSFP